MYKNIQKGLAIGALSVIFLLQTGCGVQTFGPSPYYNDYIPTPYYVGTSGYYWGSPDNDYWNNNYYHGVYYNGNHGAYYKGSHDAYYEGNHGSYYGGSHVGFSGGRAG